MGLDQMQCECKSPTRVCVGGYYDICLFVISRHVFMFPSMFCSFPFFSLLVSFRFLYFARGLVGFAIAIVVVIAIAIDGVLFPVPNLLVCCLLFVCLFVCYLVRAVSCLALPRNLDYIFKFCIFPGGFLGVLFFSVVIVLFFFAEWR